MSREGWKTIRLGELLGGKGYIRGPFGSALKRGEMEKIGIPVYEQQHAIYNTRDFRFFIGENKYEEMKRFTVKENDLIVSCSGTIGRISIIRSDDPKGIISQALLILRPNNSKILPEYLMYYFSTNEGYNNLVSASHGSVQVNIASRDIVENIEIEVPEDLAVQQRIVSILSALDEKIELNRQTNATLEAIAQAIFKEWFVDFNFPGATGEMQDSELGPIPKGWRVGQLDEVVIFQRGFDLPTNDRTPGQYVVVAASGPSGTHNQFMVRGPGVTTGRSGVLGNVFYVHDDYWPLNTSLWIKEFKHATAAYTFYFLRGIDFGAYNGGSAVPTLNRNHIHGLPVLIPSMNIILAFDAIAQLLLKRQKVNDDECIYLAKTRDNLLPKLMSEEIDVGARRAVPLPNIVKRTTLIEMG